MRPLLVMALMLFMAGGVHAQVIKPVSLKNTPDSAMVYLKGSASYDSLSKKYISYKWFVQSGSSGATIQSVTSAGTKVVGLIPGTYQFGFIVTDSRLNKADTSYTSVTVKKP
jgi:hypothetical protein